MSRIFPTTHLGTGRYIASAATYGKDGPPSLLIYPARLKHEVSDRVHQEDEPYFGDGIEIVFHNTGSLHVLKKVVERLEKMFADKENPAAPSVGN